MSGVVGLYREQGGIENTGATVYASQVESYSIQVTNRMNQVTALLNIAGRFLASGQAKINEFLAALGIKPEFQIPKALMEQRS